MGSGTRNAGRIRRRDVTVTIKRFVAFDGLIHHSIRKRTDGFFQIFRDGYTLEDGSQPYWAQDEPISGLFESAAGAEEELLRSQMQFRPVISN
jgi:hypothetical protein